MKEFKGTKGEWSACCTMAEPHFLFGRQLELTICSFIKEQETGVNYSIEEMQANAKLIAAAPDLLEALRNILTESKDPHSNMYFIKTTCERAISKALD